MHSLFHHRYLHITTIEGNVKSSTFDKIFGPDWTYSKESSLEVSFGDKPKFIFTGTGTMTLRAYSTVSLSANVIFDFE